MSNGILDLLADSAVGLVSGQRRLENFEQRSNPDSLNELLGYKQAMLNEMAPAYKEKLMEKQGVTDEMDLNINSSYDNYMRSFGEARDAAFADNLAADLSKTAVGGFFAPFQETGVLAASLLPGGVKPLSEEERQRFESMRVKTPVDMEFLEEQLGAPPTEEEIKAAEEFIYQNSPTSNIAYGLGLITEMRYPTLFAYKYGPKALQAMYNFVKKKPAAAVAVGGGAAGSGFSPKIKAKVPKPKSEATKKIEETAQSFGKIESQATQKGRSLRSDTIEPEQLELIKKYREEGLSALQIAAKPDISYGKTTINSV